MSLTQLFHAVNRQGFFHTPTVPHHNLHGFLGAICWVTPSPITARINSGWQIFLLPTSFFASSVLLLTPNIFLASWPFLIIFFSESLCLPESSVKLFTLEELVCFWLGTSFTAKAFLPRSCQRCPLKYQPLLPPEFLVFLLEL
ncbi:uncharacterized protein DS421_13g419940 [Arachis hypogaea]|nr:uncharacterized protein DS421_13g419940 [Arachis hypogaea]